VVNFQVLRRTQASMSHKYGIDPKVAADQRGHGIGVAIDTYTESDLETRRAAVTKLEQVLSTRKAPNKASSVGRSGSEDRYQGNQRKAKEEKVG
jgi:hypothetical protein